MTVKLAVPFDITALPVRQAGVEDQLRLFSTTGEIQPAGGRDGIGVIEDLEGAVARADDELEALAPPRIDDHDRENICRGSPEQGHRGSRALTRCKLDSSRVAFPVELEVRVLAHTRAPGSCYHRNAGRRL
jgi:hypothetical protein